MKKNIRIRLYKDLKESITMNFKSNEWNWSLPTTVNYEFKGDKGIDSFKLQKKDGIYYFYFFDGCGVVANKQELFKNVQKILKKKGFKWDTKKSDLIEDELILEEKESKLTDLVKKLMNKSLKIKNIDQIEFLNCEEALELFNRDKKGREQVIEEIELYVKKYKGSEIKKQDLTVLKDWFINKVKQLNKRL